MDCNYIPRIWNNGFAVHRVICDKQPYCQAQCPCAYWPGVIGEDMLTGTIKGDRFVVIFEHDCFELQEEMDDYLFWRESCGYVQIWLLNGTVYDVLKRDECRFMYE